MTKKIGYQCRGCSYQGRQFPQGICPACGSSKVQRIQDSDTAEQTPPRWRLLLLVALWGYLTYALWDKFTP